MKKVVLISGKKGSGKTTTALAFPEEYELLAFADSLKDMISVSMGIERGILDNNKDLLIEDLDLTVGELLQKMGDCVRTVHPDYFIISLQNKILSSERSHFVVHDLRYLNELQKMLEMEDIEILSVRLSGRCGTDSRSTTHLSETDLDTYQGWDLGFNTLNWDTNEIVEEILNY